jgi:hypothetical protein
MSRMLEALKSLESRRSPIEAEPPAPRKAPPALPLEPSWPIEQLPPAGSQLPAVAEEHVAPLILLPHQPELPAAPFEKCLLPTATEIPAAYLQLAGAISGQLAATYSNALLFVSPDHWSDACFSMTQLAQAFGVQSAGDVLLVDGDLRHGRLSKVICPPGPGMTEVMLGTSTWEDVIHPTNSARIDFVARGASQVPTIDRPEFGWNALRPKYRAVLIGLAAGVEPEAIWLAARCDAVYFVISRPHTRRQAASTAINALRSAGANVQGSIVVND